MQRFADAFSPRPLTAVVAKQHVALAITAQPLYVSHMKLLLRPSTFSISFLFHFDSFRLTSLTSNSLYDLMKSTRPMKAMNAPM